MIDVKFIDEKSMLILIKDNDGYKLLGPPYDVSKKKTMNIDNAISFNLSFKYQNEDQFKMEMTEFQKMFAINLNQSIVLKYSGGMTKNFTPQEIKNIFIKRLNECIEKNHIPEIIYHELHALQMVTGFSEKEKKNIQMSLKYSTDEVSSKINRRLSSSTLDYDSNKDRYLNSMLSYLQPFKNNLQSLYDEHKRINVLNFIRNPKASKPNEIEQIAVDDVISAQEDLLEALMLVKVAISEMCKGMDGDIPEFISDAYNEISEKYIETLKENGQSEIKSHQYRHMLQDPGLRLKPGQK